KDSLAKLVIDKKASGNSFSNAKLRAEEINYHYDLTGKTLSLDGFFTTAISNKLRNQEIEITVFIPENTVLFMDPKLNSFISSSSRFKGKTNTNSHHYKFENHEFACLDCPKEKINL